MTRRPRIYAAALSALLVLFASGVHAQAKTEKSDNKTTPSQSAKPPVAKKKVVVYYFHGDVRCTTCNNFEKYTSELMKTTFADAIKNGSLEWRIINVDKPGNGHYMQDFNLYTKSVVLQDAKSKKYKNLEGIWKAVSSKARFQEYVGKEIRAFLGEK